MGVSLACTGDIAQGRVHYDQALSLYDPAEHRPLAARYGMDARVSVLSQRSLAQWLLGYPEAALADLEDALKDAREIGHAPTLMDVLTFTAHTHISCGNYVKASAQAEEAVALADEKSAMTWKANAMSCHGSASAMTGKASDAIGMLTSGITAFRSTGATLLVPLHLSYLAGAYAQLGHYGDAWRSASEAIKIAEATKERWFEAHIHHVAGEIALLWSKLARRKQRSILSAPSRLLDSNRQSRWNSAQQ